MSDIISVEKLAYTYPGVDDTPGVPVFEDLNLKIQEGSFVAVLGTNGCGKSTLARTTRLSPMWWRKTLPSDRRISAFPAR